MSNLVRLAVAFGAGALVMYLFDPVTGRRRAMAQADFDHLTPDAAKRTVELHGEAVGARVQMASAARDNERLQARVRSKLAHLVDRPNDVDIEVYGGLVVLSGHVKVSELDAVIDAVGALPGVDEVQSELTTHVGPPETAGEELPRH